MVHLARLRETFASVTLVPLDMRWQKLRAAPYLATLRPMTLPVFHRGTLQRAVDRSVRALRPDVLFAESSSMAPYALAHPSIPLVMDFVDVDSAKWRAYVDRATGPAKLVYLREGWALARYERTVAFATATISTVTADREKGAARGHRPGLRRAHAPERGRHGVLHGARRGGGGAAPSAVFFGAMDYYANVDAAVFLVREVLPRVRARHPGFKVVIAGSKPTPEVQALTSVPGVSVTGYVSPTFVRTFARVRPCAWIPLRVARGVQNKVLGAMAMGVPVPGLAAGRRGDRRGAWRRLRRRADRRRRQG